MKQCLRCSQHVDEIKRMQNVITEKNEEINLLLGSIEDSNNWYYIKGEEDSMNTLIDDVPVIIKAGDLKNILSRLKYLQSMCTQNGLY